MATSPRPRSSSRLPRLQDEIRGDAEFYGTPKLDVNDAGDLALSDGAGCRFSATATRQQARSGTCARTIFPPPSTGSGARVLVTGPPAISLDYFNMTDDYRPIVFAFVLSLSFILLTVVFHSLVVPLKAILMNLLSVSAAYGLMVLVFQKGVGAGLLGFQQVRVVEAWVPLFLFSILFGLSMDYHVFLLGRIRETLHENGRQQ